MAIKWSILNENARGFRTFLRKYLALASLAESTEKILLASLYLNKLLIKIRKRHVLTEIGLQGVPCANKCCVHLARCRISELLFTLAANAHNFFGNAVHPAQQYPCSIRFLGQHRKLESSVSNHSGASIAKPVKPPHVSATARCHFKIWRQFVIHPVCP